MYVCMLYTMTPVYQILVIFSYTYLIYIVYMYCIHILGKWLYSQKDMHLRTLTPTTGAGAAKVTAVTGNKMLPERASKIQQLIDQGMIMCM